jgi:hypothetical protein
MRGIIAVAVAAIAAGSVALLAAVSVPSNLTMEAKLVEPARNALKKEAAVEVHVTGLKLVEPQSVGEKPRKGEGHLHYQVDSGPVIATTATNLSFHELRPGKHQIKVMPAANDHLPLGPSKLLEVTIP